jgi:hypothetical protein
VVKWVEETWDAEVGRLGAEEADPVDALIAVARAMPSTAAATWLA